MGQNNRQRRAAKQRERARTRRTRTGATPAGFNHDGFDHDGFDHDGFENHGFEDHSFDHAAFDQARFDQPGFDQEGSAARAASLMLSRALIQAAQTSAPLTGLQDFQRCAQRHQQAAVDDQFTLLVDSVIKAGWTPLDLHEVLRRRSAGPAAAHLLDVVAVATAQHPAQLIPPRWQAQLDMLGAGTPRTAGLSHSFDWGHRLGLDWPVALGHLLQVLVILCALPPVERVMAAPGESPDARADGDGVDSKMLRRVRALLAKAESTEHPDEADALTAKAQELMTRHSIDRAVAESAQPLGSAPVSRRLWLESPYVDAKALLVHAVADANNCKAIHASAWGFVSIVGHSADLDLVELLTTSLLVQATRAMNQAGPQVNRYGESRTRSFRQSFLAAYAGRIGERLRESAHAAESTYDSDHGGALVPVLAARRHAVEDKVADLFPHLVHRRLSVSNAAGWGAGRAAADLAQFDVHASVRSRAG